MWLRINGAAEFVIDISRAFALIDAGEAEAIDALPERLEAIEVPEPVAAPVKAKGRAKK